MTQGIKLAYIPVRVYSRASRARSAGPRPFNPVHPHDTLYKGRLQKITGYNGIYSDWVDLQGPAPQPTGNAVKLFTKGSLEVIADTRCLAEPTAAPAVDGAPSAAFTGPTTFSFDTAWSQGYIDGYMPDHRVVQFQAAVRPLLEPGTCDPTSGVEGTFVVPKWEYAEGILSDISATWSNDTGLVSDLIDQVDLIAAKLAAFSIVSTPGSEIQTEAVTADGRTLTYARCPSAITIKKDKGTVYADGLLQVFAVEQGGVVKLHTRIPPGLSAAADAAQLAADEWTKQLANAVSAKSRGGTATLPPAVRPPATEAPELPLEVKAMYDAWWIDALAVRNAAASGVPPTEDSAYAKYVAAGGLLTKAQWLQLGQDKGAEGAASKSFWDYASDALGYTADKAGEGLGWIGNKGVEIAKEWGPAGVVGAYGGVKAVNATSEATLSKWLPLVGIGFAILLLRK